MYNKIKNTLKNELQEIKDAGLYKSERIITSSEALKLPEIPNVYIQILILGQLLHHL